MRTKQVKTRGKRGPYKKRASKAVVNKVAKSVQNPFEIMTDMSMSRAGIPDENVTLFYTQIKKLQSGNKNQSVNIPTNLYPEKKDAYNLIRMVRYVIKQEKENIVLGVKSITSLDKKTYLGTRVFRLQ